MLDHDKVFIPKDLQTLSVQQGSCRVRALEAGVIDLTCSSVLGAPPLLLNALLPKQGSRLAFNICPIRGTRQLLISRSTCANMENCIPGRIEVSQSKQLPLAGQSERSLLLADPRCLYWLQAA